MKLSSYSCEEVTSFKKAMIGLCDYVLTGGSSQVIKSPLPWDLLYHPLAMSLADCLCQFQQMRSFNVEYLPFNYVSTRQHVAVLLTLMNVDFVVVMDTVFIYCPVRDSC